MSAAEIQKNELLNGQDKLEKKLNQTPEQFQNEIEANYNEIIQNTPLHQKILTVVAMPEFNDHPEFKGKTPEQRAEYLFRKINV